MTRHAPRGAVKESLTLFRLTGPSPYSSEVQQPKRAEAILG